MAALLGLGFGLLSSLANATTWPPAQLLTLVTGTELGYVAVGWAAGRCARHWRFGALLGVGALSLAVTAYYATDLARGVYSETGSAGSIIQWDWLIGDLRYWLAMAVAAGVVFGLLGAGSHRRGIIGLICLCAVPCYWIYSLYPGLPGLMDWSPPVDRSLGHRHRRRSLDSDCPSRVRPHDTRGPSDRRLRQKAAALTHGPSSGDTCRQTLG